MDNAVIGHHKFLSHQNGKGDVIYSTLLLKFNRVVQYLMYSMMKPCTLSFSRFIPPSTEPYTLQTVSIFKLGKYKPTLPQKGTKINRGTSPLKVLKKQEQPQLIHRLIYS